MGTKTVRPYLFIGDVIQYYFKGNKNACFIHFLDIHLDQCIQIQSSSNDLLLRDLSRVALGNSTPESWNAFSQV